MLLLDLCSQPHFTRLTWSVYTYLLEFFDVGPWWDEIAHFNFMAIEPLVITCTAALGALSIPIGTAAIDKQFTLWVMDIHCLNQLLLEHVITWGQVLFWNECFRNLRMSFLAAFENLCLFDDAKKVASNVLLLMAVPSLTGCSPAEISPRIACVVLAVWNYFVAREFLVCIWTCRSLIPYLRCCFHLFISAFRACMACKTKQMCNQNKSFSWLF